SDRIRLATLYWWEDLCRELPYCATVRSRQLANFGNSAELERSLMQERTIAGRACGRFESQNVKQKACFFQAMSFCLCLPLDLPVSEPMVWSESQHETIRSHLFNVFLPAQTHPVIKKQ